jgi:hypothetical protein
LIVGLLGAAGLGWWQRDALRALSELCAPEAARANLDAPGAFVVASYESVQR